jgi:hypothetical protein
MTYYACSGSVEVGLNFLSTPSWRHARPKLLGIILRGGGLVVCLFVIASGCMLLFDHQKLFITGLHGLTRIGLDFIEHVAACEYL